MFAAAVGQGLATPCSPTGPRHHGHFPRHVLASRSQQPHMSAMCGRYASYLPPAFIARLFGTVNPLPDLRPTWNMAPTQDALFVRWDPERDERHLDVLTWGLVPSFTKDLKRARKPINARSETGATSGMFKAAFAKRRCLVPAAAYYEWRNDPEGKVPFAVARLDGAPVAFGGIWEAWSAPDGETLRTFSTITTEANRQLSAIQPVCRSSSSRPTGRYGLAKRMAMLLRC